MEHPVDWFRSFHLQYSTVHNNCGVIKLINEVLEVIECVDTSRNMEQTFCNPNQSEKSDLSVETEESFKCTICEYEAMTKHDLKNHEDEKHNWCWVCDKHFETKREFKVHHYSVHSSSRGIWD